ncbi:hypothetical protein F4009_17345 [Candidatus Poribacteria bacterium]|nr:hypothetical protein [Candidatus Poribacteria bacterium]MYK95731.1 hypothetical protein [Candidatus Poribacteria bacterium]
MNNTPLSKFFQIKGRFRRSVHLERDFYTENALDGYILTVTAREMLSRVVATLENETTSKAWTLTGPYGSGKSAFALFTAKLLGGTDIPANRQALKVLKDGDTALYERFMDTKRNGNWSLSGLCPVLISGERAPLPIALLRGLEQGLKTSEFLSVGSLQRKIRKLLRTAANGTPPQASEITALFELATSTIRENGGQGLLLVIDELGKFLEYAAQDPVQGDVFVLQTLAEFAARSDQTPLFLLTILHQAFEQYASKAAKSQEEEWAKIQGRFEDIAFVEPTEQVLRLIGSAIEKISGNEEPNLSLPTELELKLSQLTEDEFSELLRSCLPLHPTVVLVIDSIFRRFGQNERSLFAFLSSSEPHGLQDFLFNQRYNRDTLPLFSIADLYDYLKTNMGNRLYISPNSKKWAEIESAIGRLSDSSAMSAKLIKTIGILGIVGESIPNLKASEPMLRYALDDKTDGFFHEFEIALDTLKDRSIATYRLYHKAYALWEGSDIDIEAKLREAERHIDTKGSLATDLSRYLPTRPLVARRHLFETGTLRYFAVRYTDLENFDADLKKPLGDADGLVLYTLSVNEHEVNQLVEKASENALASRQEVLIAIPQTTGTLQEAVTQLTHLYWVSDNIPELDGDRIARLELSIQQVQAEKEVSDRLTAIFGEDGKNACTWYHQGQSVNINSQRSRNAHLSEICDDIYDKSPIIRNELINRREISGAATTARKNLIKAMLENGDKKNLGIKSYPPQMSIYCSLLWNTGIHREVEGVWGFHPPKTDDKNGMEQTWKVIEDFLEKCEGERQSIVKLYKCLMAPPLGVRNGPLPILLCAAMLHYKTEIALYENGSFIPDWSMPVFERLLKVPQQFELKRFQIAGIRADLLTQFSEALNQPVEVKDFDLLTVVTPLIRSIAQLPRYALTTQELSDTSKNVREAVLKAHEPDELLFNQLPEALGFPAFGTETAIDAKIVSDFFTTLQDALSELEQAYEVLLNFIEQLLVKAFNLTSKKEELRTELAARAEPLLEITIETDFKGFLIQICRDGHDFTSWLEAIATYLTKKPPASWVDLDKAQFESKLSQFARKFRHFEAVSYEKWKHTELSGGEPIRIGVTRPKQPEQEQVVILPATAEEQANKLERAIEQVLDETDTDQNPEFHLAVLARISQKLMSKDKEKRY